MSNDKAISIPPIGQFAPDIRSELMHDVLTQAEFDGAALKLAYEIAPGTSGLSYAAEFLSELPSQQLNTFAAILFAVSEKFRTHFAAYHTHKIVDGIHKAHELERRLALRNAGDEE